MKSIREITNSIVDGVREKMIAHRKTEIGRLLDCHMSLSTEINRWKRVDKDSVAVAVYERALTDCANEILNLRQSIADLQKERVPQ